jgi:hypothetical protein
MEVVSLPLEGTEELVYLIFNMVGLWGVGFCDEHFPHSWCNLSPFYGCENKCLYVKFKV